MTIYTSYFARADKIHPSIPRVSIALKTPPNLSSNVLLPEQFRCIVPTPALLRMWKSTHDITMYTQVYCRQIESLNVPAFIQWAGNCVLLCWERPDKFCHRHVLAVILRRYGANVVELNFSPETLF